MIGTAISILGLGHSYLNSIQTKKNINEVLITTEQNGIKIEKLSESIFYLVDSMSVSASNLSNQVVLNNLKKAKEILSPIQNEFKLPLLSGAIIESPQKIQSSIIERPKEVFLDIQPLRYAKKSVNSNLIPIIFEENNRFFVGWQMKGTLPYLFNFKYDDLLLDNIFLSRNKSKIIKISDFKSFLGLNYGDSIDKAIDLFGKPSSVTKDKFLGLFKKSEYISYQYDDGGPVDTGNLIIDTNLKSKNISNIQIDLGFMTSIKNKFIDSDKKISILKMHKDSIIQLFGNPVDDELNILKYEVDDIMVLFWCSDINKECHSITVYWEKFNY